MKTTSSIGLIALAAPFVSAFSNTLPIIAWTSEPAQQPFPATNSAETAATDLCDLNSVLLISAPGLHASDFNLLPSLQDSPRGVRSALDYYKESSVRHPYVPIRNGFASPAEKLAKRFVNECGAVVEKVNEKNFWSGSAGKVMKIEVVRGLDEWELIGSNARIPRKAIMENLDQVVSSHLTSLAASGPYLAILTSLPEFATASLRSNKVHSKRQFYDDVTETFDEGASEESSNLVNDEDWPSAVAPLQNVVPALAPNRTSIFSPGPNSGLLHRYVFFTPTLVFGLLISLLILIPTVVYASLALTSTETVAGLETKMTGSINLGEGKN